MSAPALQLRIQVRQRGSIFEAQGWWVWDNVEPDQAVEIGRRHGLVAEMYEGHGESEEIAVKAVEDSARAAATRYTSGRLGPWREVDSSVRHEL